jgi:hypothetical protein
MSWLPKFTPDVDENYGDDDDESGQSARGQDQSARGQEDQSAQNVEQSQENDFSRLVLPLGHVEAPSVLLPDLPRSQGGPVARFSSQQSPPQSPLYFDYNLDTLHSWGLQNQNLNPDDMARALSTRASMHAALESAPEIARTSAPNASLIAALTQPVVDTEEPRLSPQLTHLSRLIRHCENTPELRRLLRLIVSIVNAPDNVRVLRRMLRELNAILQTRRRVDIARGVTNITYSRRIRSLRCRSARARTRRLLHEFISHLRDEILERIERIRGLRMTRRSLPPPHAKGGTRKYNKSLKRKH